MSPTDSSGVGSSVAERDAVDESRRGSFVQRVSSGQLGSLRVLIGLVVIWAIFQIANDRFLTSINLENLMLQITAVATISIGVVMVLLLGEIDLSVGAVSGLAAGVMAVLNVKHGVSPELAILAGLGVGAAIGLFNGIMVTKFNVPSFVVTLAGLLGWQGVLLYVLGDTGTINLPASTITELTSTFFSNEIGWILGLVTVGAFVLAAILKRRKRAKAGLDPGPILGVAIRLGLTAVAVLAAVWVMNDDRGVPLAVVIMLVLMAIFTFITERMRFGRHIFAVGGSVEASRRAGIRVDGVKIAVFTLASTLAAAGGILAASRLLAVNQSSGAGDLLLLAIAGPVIAGTSLFGGRGFIFSALLGALVIGSISNGMDLLALESSVKYMITGAVLLAAVTLDSVTQKRRTPT
ncbi:MAG: sugar ABC transporter permease [Thermoleophilia bacterium]|nr:sugar ABC transporter permease [Thermoleophilia bacterium]